MIQNEHWIWEAFCNQSTSDISRLVWNPIDMQDAHVLTAVQWGCCTVLMLGTSNDGPFHMEGIKTSMFCLIERHVNGWFHLAWELVKACDCLLHNHKPSLQYLLQAVLFLALRSYWFRIIAFTVFFVFKKLVITTYVILWLIKLLPVHFIYCYVFERSPMMIFNPSKLDRRTIVAKWWL